MKTKRTLLMVGTLSGITLAASPTPGHLQPMVVTNLTGGLRIQHEIPCDDDVDLTTPVVQGGLEITPAEGIDVPGGKSFTLTRANLTFAGFSIHRSCLGFDRTRTYSEVGVQLGRAVPFTATPSSPGVFSITIPKDDFLIYQAAIVNGDLDSGYKNPSEAVTGTLDLEHGTMTMRVVLATKVHFEAGCVCVPYVGCACAIDEDGEGTLTATLSGTIVFPDSDADGVPDRSDNCPLVANTAQGPVATPIVRAPSDRTLASCADDQIGAPIAVDVCDGGPVTVTNNAPDPFAIGANVVTWRVVDAKGRVGIDTQTVTVVDTTPPAFTSVPGDIALNNCGAADLGVPTAEDDCAGTPTFTNDAPASFPVGPTVVTWTATDASGNHATATQTVTVTDTVAPTVVCAAGSNPGGRSRGGGFLQVTATDACTALPVLRLGAFELANGEVIKITERGRPGVRLVNVMGPGRVRHFQVGHGDGVITATDESANVGSAVCPAP